MLFNHKQETVQSPEDHEAEALRTELGEITAEEQTLFGKGLAERFKPNIDKLTARQGEIHKRKMEIRDRLDEIEESQSLPKAAELIRNNRNDLVIKVNDERLKIPESLQLEICFTCGHTLKIEAHKLFLFQTSIKSNKHLLEFWKTVIANHESHSKLLTCERCQREHREYIKKNYVVPRERIGTARLTVQVI
jgi:hypothetical protein